MDVDYRIYPTLLPGLLHLRGTRLTEIAQSAGISLEGIRPGYIGGIGEAILDQINDIDDLRTLLTSADLDIIGPKIYLGLRADWNKPYLSYDDAVFAQLFRRNENAVIRPLRKSSRNASNTKLWPEFATLKVWSALEDSKRRKAGQSLASTLGKDFQFLELTGPHQLARFQDETLKLTFIAVPGGTYTMGLNDEEKKELTRKAKKLGSEEAKLFVRDISETARPVHEVTLPPFLCAQIPVTSAQGKKLTKTGTLAGGKHKVHRYNAQAALTLTKQCDARLLSEAEWEYIARAGESRAWLSGNEDFQTYTVNALSSDLFKGDGHPFCIYGLGWGTWVEDGWHPSYHQAPADGSAWEPREIPYVGRGGAFLSHPWQTAGEEFMLHAAYREQLKGVEFPILLARDLPAKKK